MPAEFRWRHIVKDNRLEDWAMGGYYEIRKFIVRMGLDGTDNRVVLQALVLAMLKLRVLII
jgi:hypothetical protein